MIKGTGLNFTNNVFPIEVKRQIEEISKHKKTSKLHIFGQNCIPENHKEFINSINICVSGENIYYKISKIFGEQKIRRKFGILGRIAIRILKSGFLPIPKRFITNEFLCRPKLVNYIEKIAHPKSKNFAIITNANQSANILNFPYFFHTCYHKFNDFIEIKKENRYRNKKKFCAFVVKNSSSIHRNQFFRQLCKYKKVDSFGPLFNNAKVPAHLIDKYKNKGVSLEAALNVSHYTTVTNSYLLNQELFRDYKFVICFENSVANDYVTEKLPNVMLANSIGIYRGAKNVGDFFNTKSFINYDDYGSHDAMIKKIIALDQDDQKYQEMLDEPFFVNNELPPRIRTAKKDLEDFILKIVNTSIEKTGK